ncbi:hypothetical protein [Nodularia sphaerocarpa]|uniref:hypothetical protein n=1 Tax=Nodularia sphaerocarpa TaxID=137816 RepID=UPI001EFC18CF|nr:hypothetical protein [Nodularia sphaerocarpa]MDB9376102.1 hypothetical protein [Nodularia sphaerocarpa CS-585]MDB9377354.1 hypothetical protein [Nodularia sphaerocarpa CS-585A2]ULP72026.1 hypothetical protein BDGGKGIB_01663 [Nodularia sphaerocarpa UHCC 0038]
MKNNAQKPTSPLFQPVNLEQQDSVIGGQGIDHIRERINDLGIRVVTNFVTPLPNIFPPGFGPCGRLICAINLAPSPVEPQ